MAKKNTSVEIKPLFDRVLVREETEEDEETTTESGIIIPESVGDEDQHGGATRGEVVAVGDGKLDDDGERQPMPVDTGDTVLFSWGDKLTIDGVDYHIVESGNILAIVEG